MTKNHFFYVFEVVVQRPHANASYGQMGMCLMDKWVSNPFPLVISTKSLSVVPQNTGVGPKTAHSHCWAWMGRIMVWPGGVRSLKLIKDSLDGTCYHDILARCVVPKVQ